MITASELGQITSAKGGIIETNLSYIRAKRWERKHGFSHPVFAHAMEVGNQQEPMIYEWCKANLGFNEIVYSKDLPEIPFWIAADCPVGASPDAYVTSERLVFEFKTLVGNTAIEYFGDEYTPYEEKKLAVWKDHGDQLLGQFISNSVIEEIWLVKYIFQDDDILEDTDSPLASWRGLVFKFRREDYEASIEAMRERIILFDKMIDAPISPADFKKGEWYVENGELKKR
jgi:hypothetical protein